MSIFHALIVPNMTNKVGLIWLSFSDSNVFYSYNALLYNNN